MTGPRGDRREHQEIGTQKLIENPVFALFDEMGVGKSKQLIDAAMVLFKQGVIDRVLVVCPSAVRSVWFNQEFGELQKWLWFDVHNRIGEYHAKRRFWAWEQDDSGSFLHWIVTNYDFIRKPERLEPLLGMVNEKTLLVLDESSAVKNYKAKQARACFTLRKRCGRVVLFNGTPISQNPGDMFMQGFIMDPNILGCESWFHFRARYAIMGGFQRKNIVGWVDVDDIQRRFKPFVIRRLKEQCLDLPPKLDPVTIEVPLTNKTWKMYKEMRDDFVTWLETSDEMSVANQAVVKAVRLFQLTNGFLGGVTNLDGTPEKLVEVGKEKVDFFLSWLGDRLYEDPTFKLIAWSRFTAELERLWEAAADKFPDLLTGAIYGNQTTEEREVSLKLLDPVTSPKTKPVVIFGNAQAGGMGLNLTAAHNVMYMSTDHNLKNRLQSMDRVHRPGQTKPVSYFDICATGPNGQRTVDHLVIKALREKKNLADMTTEAWVYELTMDD